MQVIGLIAAFFIGLSLGLIGGGGSILTMPVLVYLFGISPLVATSYSLFVVGSTSLVGMFSSMRKGLIDFNTAILFGVSSVITVYVTRKFILPILPTNFVIGSYSISISIVTMVLFAILMLVASLSMILRKEETLVTAKNKSIFSILLYGVGIGLITGFLGAGGGFLLIPALVLLLQLPMKKAIGTSLLIIAFNSLVGFIGDAGHFEMNYKLLFSISAIAIAGVLIGGMLGKKIHPVKLKKGFGWFVLIMGIYIIVKEVFLIRNS